MTSSLDMVQSVPRVATLIYRTHQLWQEFRDVPEGILGLVEQLKALEPMFCEIEDHFSQDNISAVYKNSLDLSRKAYNSLETLVTDMMKHMQSKKRLKRQYATVKIMLQKSILDRLQQGLSRCLNLLQIAIQAYQMAMLRRLSSETIASRVQSQLQTHIYQPLPPLPQPKNSQFEIEEREMTTTMTKTWQKNRPNKRSRNYTPSQYGRFVWAYTKATGAWQANIQLPAWLSNSVYEIFSAPAIAGWTYSYRVYTVIPTEAEIIAKVQEGDLMRVRQLFSSRKASPFDRDINGETLLHHATSSRQYEICQLLLHMGLHSALDEQRDLSDGFGSPLARVATNMEVETRGMGNSSLDVVRKIAKLFTSYLQEPDALPVERLLDFVREFALNDSFVSVFRELFMPKYYFRMLRDRLEVVRLGAFNLLDNRTFRRLISEDGSITRSDVIQSSREKLSLLHSVAVGFGIRYTEDLMPYRRPIAWANAYCYTWGECVKEMVLAASRDDLHSIELVVPWDAYDVPSWEGTPLNSIIGGVLCYLRPENSFYHWNTMVHGVLRHWLELLQSADIDLFEYGRRERSILHGINYNTKGAFDADATERSRTIPRHPMTVGSPRPRLARHRKAWSGHDQHWVPFRIIDIQIGASPDDWELIWAFEFEYMANQFWKSIEKEEETMPGAWVEE